MDGHSNDVRDPRLAAAIERRDRAEGHILGRDPRDPVSEIWPPQPPISRAERTIRFIAIVFAASATVVGALAMMTDSTTEWARHSADRAAAEARQSEARARIFESADRVRELELRRDLATIGALRSADERGDVWTTACPMAALVGADGAGPGGGWHSVLQSCRGAVVYEVAQ